jgi:hypothetical protein
MGTKFGAVVSTAEWSFKESFLATTLNLPIATNSSAQPTLGTFTMPFTGSLVAEIWMQAIWSSGEQAVQIAGNVSTPTPASGAYGVVVDQETIPSGGQLVVDIPMSVSWTGLVLGTLVTVKAAVFTGGGPAVTLGGVGGFLRACRT